MTGTVLFVCPGRYSVGELHNALVIGGQLRAAGWSVHYLVSHRLADYAAVMGHPMSVLPARRHLDDVVLATVRAVRPDAIVMADHYLLALEPPTFELATLLAAGPPLATIDAMEFGPASRELSLAISVLPGIPDSIRRWYPPTVTVPALPDSVRVFYPVPIARPRPDEGAFRLYGRPPTTSPETRERVRRELGIAEGRTMIVLSQSSWASTALKYSGRSTHAGSEFGALQRKWLTLVLSRLGRPVSVIGVARDDDHHLSVGPVEYVGSTFLGIPDYDDLLGAADLFLTDNVTSCSAARAILHGVPAVVMVGHGAAVRSDRAVGEVLDHIESAFPGFDFPFLVNPFGWESELAGLLDRNPYLQALPKAPLYDATELARTITTALDDPAQPAARRRLLDSMDPLPSAADVITDWLNNRANPTEHVSQAAQTAQPLWRTND